MKVGLRPRPLGYPPQAIGPLTDKSLSPQGHRLEIDPQIVGDEFVLVALGCGQDDLAALRNLLWGLVS